MLIYSGDQDLCVPYTGSEAWTSALGLPLKAAWHPWHVSSNQVRIWELCAVHNERTWLGMIMKQTWLTGLPQLHRADVTDGTSLHVQFALLLMPKLAHNCSEGLSARLTSHYETPVFGTCSSLCLRTLHLKSSVQHALGAWNALCSLPSSHCILPCRSLATKPSTKV